MAEYGERWWDGVWVRRERKREREREVNLNQMRNEEEMRERVIKS